MKFLNRLVMAITSAVLLFAAFTKLKQALTQPIIAASYWDSREFYIIQIPLLIGLAIWLVCGIFRKIGWLTAVIAFLIFSARTAYMITIDSATCGCFGEIEINPWISLSAIDIPILLLLLAFRPKDEKFFPPPWPKPEHFIACALPTILLLGLTAYTTIAFEPPAKTENYELVEKEEWVGKALPMMRHIDVADQLTEGLSVIFFYHYDCPTCITTIPIYDEMCRELGGGGDINFAFIEMPPYGEPQDNPIPQDTMCITGQLDNRKKWYTSSPLLIATQDGIVMNVWQVDLPKSLDELMAQIMGEAY